MGKRRGFNAEDAEDAEKTGVEEKRGGRSGWRRKRTDRDDVVGGTQTEDTVLKPGPRHEKLRVARKVREEPCSIVRTQRDTSAGSPAFFGRKYEVLFVSQHKLEHHPVSPVIVEPPLLLEALFGLGSVFLQARYSVQLPAVSGPIS